MVWILTLYRQEQATPPGPHHQHVEITLYFLFIGAIVVAFYYIAGFEIAYTDLRDKDPSQVLSVGRQLQEMQQREDIVYDAKEWCAVVLIAILTILTDRDPIIAPLIGEGHWGSAFSLLVTTLPLVWLAQIPAKERARQNSERFLQRSRFVWPILKAVDRFISLLQLQAVPHLLLKAGEKDRKAGRRNLPPSLPAFYVSSLKRYGYALHELMERGTISAEGEVTMHQRGIVHAVAGSRKTFSRSLSFDGAVKPGPQVKILRAFRLPQAGESIDDICHQMQSLNDKSLPQNYQEVDTKLFEARPILDPKKPNQVNFEIECSFEIPPKDGKSAFAFEYEIEAASDAGSFQTRHKTPDYLWREFEFPCRIYDLTLELSPTANFCFTSPVVKVTFHGNPHPDEENRLIPELGKDARSINLKVPYTLAGANYRMEWTVW